MDKIDEIKKEIEIIDTIDDSNISDLDALCEDIIELNNEGWDTAILMDPLFRILEKNSDFDFGMPGQIVHTLEKHYKKGLEEELFKSLNRKPTFYTLWMLNRIINGTSDAKEKECYMEMLKSILKMEIPDYLKKQAQHLIDLHS
ncbi:hypothetical protein [Prevotella pallens]|jgi:hypothetical protein|uniref:Immunity protein 30 domain-containing protein n=3 Tax=Prevotella pallens TaxID=60133 RepID=A0ABX9DQ55_9BACT|nr:hypothetical protein [Prevotella pallens]EGQ19933.1 hypothetical protein HMPREF9144_0808 [Prevotella pallens ATCC 700821]MBF1500844.1 hypothetical protein [Prevotella pallens]MBF1503749.1 hypothetical protein [Prevotella pallens]RAS44746.1 hypothetical protein BC673_11559 [Prevotella pallens]